MGHLRRLRAATNWAALDDPALIENLNDPGALRELIDRHQRPLMAMANSMIRNRTDAEEIVQDTFIQAYKAHGTFRGDAKVSTWLYAICYRQVLTRTRRKRHLTVALDTINEPAATAPVDRAFHIALDAAVEQLPDPNREAFVLVDVLGFSRADAADIVGVEANTMRARVARARTLLADQLTDEACE
jgi:RNA polymerase sigma-70 factor (ECF subfamily)